MLSDEEKEALERIDYIQDFIIENGQYNADVNEMEYFSRIKNLIEKQSKEIEELKDESKEYQIGFVQGRYEKDLDWNGKIKAKIEELNKDFKEYENGQEWEIQDEIRGQIEVLQSLLEKE